MALYPEIPDLKGLSEQISLYAQLKHEYGNKKIKPVLKQAEKDLKKALKKIRTLATDKKLALKEPDDLLSIRALRPKGPRKIWERFHKDIYMERISGAFIGRMAGCTLGAPVEFWTIEKMEALAKETGNPFPPEDYWTYVPEPALKRYQMSPRESFTRNKMSGVPVDDDITYTQLGLLIAEDYGINFTTYDVGKAWIKYLPYACTAEEVALDNLKKGITWDKAGVIDNPYCEWIGADIRSDPWAYMAPGYPEKAAEMAYRDAYISHRRQGIYGEMYFAAAISAAFTVDDPVEALKLGLTEIPAHCAMAKAVRWALKKSPAIKNYRNARDEMEKQFKGMHPIHTINNACLTIWGITIGGKDFSKVIGETVAMGMDNDCTAATAGSIVGAVIGKKGIPPHWYKNFNNTVLSYLNGLPEFKIDDLLERFSVQAEKVFD